MLLKGIICIWAAMYIWREFHQVIPPKIKQFYFIFKEGVQMKAYVQWVPSTAANVVSQHVVALVNGVAVVDQVYQDNTTNSCEFPVNGGDNVTVSISCSDGTWDSPSVSDTGTAPSMPDAPTGLTISFVA